MVYKRRRKGNNNHDILSTNSGTSHTFHEAYTNSEDSYAIPEFEYERDNKNRRIITKDSLLYEPTSHEEPETQTQENETLECQEEPPMPVQPETPSPPPQPSWTTGHWLKPGEKSTQPQKPAAKDMPKALVMQRKATQRQKKLTTILSKPVEMSKAERMMQKMGWSGGALGKTGIGIVEPIVPNLIYANVSHGLGLSFEKPVKSKPPWKTKTQPPKSTPTQTVKKSKPARRAERRQLNKGKRKADKITLKTNALKIILDFVKNDNETEIVFHSHLRPIERLTIHQLVNDVIASDSGEPLGSGCDTFLQMDLVTKIREFNSLILKTQSYGDKKKRMLHIYKDAPSHVFLITPEDLRDQEDYEDDEEINESDLESDENYDIKEDKTDKETKEKNTSDNNDSNISDREDEKDEDNYDEINESDLESDEDYNIVGKERNKETKEKKINSSSVVCDNKSNFSERENDKDVFVENKLPTVQQTVDNTQFTEPQNLSDEKAKSNPNTNNYEEKSTNDVIQSPRKRKLSVAQQLSLSFAEKDIKQTKNKFTESENNQCDTTKSDNLRLKELNLQKSKKEGTEVESQIKSNEDWSEIDVTEKLKEFFLEFAKDEAYTELRFAGPFLDDDIQKINDLVTVVFYCIRDGVCEDDRFREILDCLSNRDFTFDVTHNFNGNPLIYKHKIETNVQQNEVIEID